MIENDDNLRYFIEPDKLNPVVVSAHIGGVGHRLNIDWRLITEFEIVYILENYGTFKILDMEYSFQKGDIIFTPPWILHSYFSGDMTVRHYAIHFSCYPLFEKQFKNNQSFKSGGQELRIELPEGLSIPILIKGFPEKRLHLFDNVIKLKEEFGLTGSFSDALRLKTAMLALFAEIVELLKEKCSKDNLILKTSLDYIDQHFTETITVPELAEMEQLSSNYYSTVFKNFMGLSVVEYITRKRINLAKKLMLESNRKIHEIAIECGFDDPFYFSKVFKKYETKSPQQYCKQLIV